MSDALTDGGLLQVGPASVDESLDEGSPTDSITTSMVPGVDSIPPEESVVPGTVNDNGTQDVVDPVDETPAEKYGALRPQSSDGMQNGEEALEGAPQQEGIGTPLGGKQAAKTAPAADFFPRLIASITHRPQSKKALIITLLLFSLLLASTFIPAIEAFQYGMNAYTTYKTLHDDAYDGVQHLLNVKTIFTGLSAHPTGFLDMSKLPRAQKEFVAARKDFQQVQYTLDHAAIVSTV